MDTATALSPGATNLLAKVTARRIPDPSRIAHHAGVQELIDAGLVRRFVDGSEPWLELADLEEEVGGQLVVAVPGAPVGSLDLRPSLF